MRRITLSLNLFTNKDMVFSSEYAAAFANALQAAKSARTCQVRVVVAVDSKDVEFFRELTGDVVGFCDVYELKHSQRFPRIADILATAYAGSQDIGDNDYTVYINADINLPYWFFDYVNLNLNSLPYGSGLIINRKDVIDESVDISSGVVCADCLEHVGFDCMAFPARAIEKFYLGECTIGLPPVGTLVVTNMLHLLPKVKLLNDSLITWHQGDGMASAWQDAAYTNMIEHNLELSFRALDELFSECAPAGEKFKIQTLTHSYGLIQRYMMWKQQARS